MTTRAIRPRHDVTATAALALFVVAVMLVSSMPFATSDIDTTKPYVVSFSPADGLRDVAIGTPITIDFSENVRSDNLPSYITLKNSKGFIVSKRTEYDNVTYRATLIPVDQLAYSTLYIVIVSQLVQDLAGNSLVRAVQWTFNTTHETIPPEVRSTTPAPGAEEVSINSTVTVLFSEAMDLTTLSLEMRDPSDTPVIGNLSKSEDMTSMSFQPLFALAYGSLYKVTVPRTCKDLVGNPMRADYVFTFTAQLEKIKPRVIRLEPIDQSVLVPRETPVVVGFSEPMNATSLSGCVKIALSTGIEVPATPYYSQIEYVLTIRPDQALKYQTLYTITVLTDAKDVAGNPLDREYVVTFTTVPIPQQSPELSAWSPPDDRFNWYEGNAAPFSVSAADPNGDILVYKWTVNGEVREGETFESFTFYPEPGSSGSYKVEVEVSDGLTAPAKHYWIVDVVPPVKDGGPHRAGATLFTGTVITLLILVALAAAILVYYYLYLMDRKREILARTRRRLRPLKFAREVQQKPPPTYEELYLRPDSVYNKPSPGFKPVAPPPSTASGVGRMSTVDTGPIMGDAPKLIDAKEVEVRRADVGPLMASAPEISKRAGASKGPLRACPKCGGKLTMAAHGRQWCDQDGWVS
jgi:methionine-rich copper-binding protein CopC